MDGEATATPERRRAAERPRRRPRATPRSTSTASSPGWTSTTVSSSWPRTRACRCWSGSSSARSTRTTSTSSSWSGSPGSTTRSRARLDARGADGMAAAEVIDGSASASIGLRERLNRCFADEIKPALAEHGIRIIALADADDSERQQVERLFQSQVFPALTPLVIGRGRPFPYISNLSLSIAVLLRNPEKDEEVAARVKVPKELLRRFLSIGDGNDLRAAGGGDRRQPRRPLPGDGDRPPLALPGHPGHRLRRLRRGRRPAAGGRGGGPPPPLRRGRPPGGVARHGAAPSRAARGGDGAGGGPAALRGRGPAGHRRPRGHLLESRASASCATRRGRG